MNWPFVKKARFEHIERLADQWGKENCRLWEALMWIDTYEPEIVAGAEERFGIDVNLAIVRTHSMETPHDL